MNVLKEKTACSVSAEPQSAHECASIIHINSITLAETKSKKKFFSVDGETLMNTPLPPIRFMISTLLPQGLSILAGAPKVGKSWLALQICLAVAKGESLWNLPVAQSPALYLCLEDSFARIQSRLFDISDNAPANIHFVILADGIGAGLEEQIENFLSEHPYTAFIVIDTLQKVRSLSNDNPYAADYHDIGLLKAIADKHGIAVLLIHHLRKQNDDDPMNMVSGTTGITGAADTSFVLKETKRGSGRATLYCTGRDIEYREIELAQDKETHCWNLETDSLENPEVLLDDMVRVFAECIKAERKFTGSPTDLAQKIADITGYCFTPAALSKKLLQSSYELEQMGRSLSRTHGQEFDPLRVHHQKPRKHHVFAVLFCTTLELSSWVYPSYFDSILWQSYHISSAVDLDKYLDSFRVLFTYNSGKIENDEITYHDTREICENGKVSGFTGNPRALLEQQNQKLCYEFLKDRIIKKESLTVEFIKEIHKNLAASTYDELRYIENEERPGEFKKHDYVTGIHEVGSDAAEVEQDLTELLDEVNIYYGDNVLKVAVYLHARFEYIHPFADGNGPVGRTILNYYLMINNHPPLIIYDEDKRNYYATLQTYDESEGIVPFVDFLRGQTEKTWEKTLDRSGDGKVVRKGLVDF